MEHRIPHNLGLSVEQNESTSNPLLSLLPPPTSSPLSSSSKSSSEVYREVLSQILRLNVPLPSHLPHPPLPPPTPIISPPGFVGSDTSDPSAFIQILRKNPNKMSELPHPSLLVSGVLQPAVYRRILNSILGSHLPPSAPLHYQQQNYEPQNLSTRGTKPQSAETPQELLNGGGEGRNNASRVERRSPIIFEG